MGIPMEDMVLDTVSILLDMVMDMVIMVMVLDILATMESVMLRLSQKPMLSMEPTDMDTDLAMDMDMDMDMDTMVEYYVNNIKSRIFLTVSNVELTNIMSCYKNEIIKTL